MHFRFKLYALLLIGVLGCGTNSAPSGERPSSTAVDAESILPISARKLSSGKVGVSAVPKNYQGTRENWLNLFKRAKESGVQILSAGNGNWDDEIEPAPGVYTWESFDNFFRVAKENGVAVVERKPLARFLYANVKVGGAIPFELYQAVAEILNFIRRAGKTA